MAFARWHHHAFAHRAKSQPKGLNTVLAVLFSLALVFASSPGSYAATQGIVVANSGGKDTAQFKEWQTFRRNIDDKSNGSILLDYLIFGELGTPKSMLDAVTTGRANIGGFGCSGLIPSIPELAATQMPYLFASDEEADFVFSHFLTRIFSEILAQHGLVLLRWSDSGFFDVYSKEPVEFPAQLGGKQIRTIGNISGPMLLQAVKAIPVEVGVNEIASSVQASKLFGGLGNLMGYSRLQPSFRYYTDTHHSYNCGMVVANKAWFESATPQEQEIIRASYPGDAEIRQDMQTQSKDLVADLSAKGSIFLKLTPEQHNAWAAAGLPLYPFILERAGGRSIEVYDLIRAGKQAYLRDPASSQRQ